MRSAWRIRFALAMCLLVPTWGIAAKDVFKVDGAGWWEDRLLDRALRNLRDDKVDQPADANAIEDAVFFAISTVAEKGFLDPQVEAEITTSDGRTFTHEFDAGFENLLARPLSASRVKLRIQRGVRYRFSSVEVEGTEPMLSAREARELVVPPRGLIPTGEAEAYTPNRLVSGLSRIELVLRERGYAEAVARVVEETRNEDTGRVQVAIEVEPGPRWWIRSATIENQGGESFDWPEIRVGRDQPWNSNWAQTQVEALRQTFLPLGFPDGEVRLEKSAADAVAGARPVDVVMVVAPGPKVLQGPVQFVGRGSVRTRTLNRRIEATEGEPLNVLAMEASRRRLSRLSAFRRASFYLSPEEGTVRSPVFAFQPRTAWETSVLAGWGSYEQLRGGFEVAGNNLFRRSHRLRLEATASLRSQRGDLLYTVPDFAGELIDGSVRFFGLDREEFAFQRQEYGTTVALSRQDLPWIEADGAVSYTFQNLAGRDNELASRSTDQIESRSASLMFTLNRDRRDNQLSPSAGYRWFGQVEVADSALGGEVGYQRVELGASWHHPLSETHGLSLGLSHGTVWTLGRANDLNLPVNKRFFPGGEHSFRGVPDGEGSPVDSTGEYVGAKSFMIVNLEFEQALTARFSAVLFCDLLAATARLSDSPWDEALYTAGAGLRYDTIIGPVRLEYGRMLNPRAVDPSGTWHFSIGFPF
ncbi:MAG: hypothetical protein SynsKO_38620 [Synoicihabitans sp.]